MGGPQVNALQLLMGGDADLVMAFDLQTLNAIEHGLPLIPVAANFQFNVQGIMAHADVRSVEDLKRHKILIASSARGRCGNAVQAEAPVWESRCAWSWQTRKRKAWEKAHGFAAATASDVAAGKTIADAAQRRRSADFTAEGQRGVHESALQAEVHDERLWLGYARLVGGRGTSAALVGTPDQVAAALMRYYDIGIRVFYLRGWDLYRDTIDFGTTLIPLFRHRVAERVAAAS
jgi:hypothetical protein